MIESVDFRNHGKKKNLIRYFQELSNKFHLYIDTVLIRCIFCESLMAKYTIKHKHYIIKVLIHKKFKKKQNNNNVLINLVVYSNENITNYTCMHPNLG